MTAMKKLLLSLLLFGPILAHAQVTMTITKHYLNIPIGRQARMKLLQLKAGGRVKLDIPVQLAEDTIGYWIFVDVHAFKGQKITLSGPANQTALQRIYQDDTINGADSMYKETNRPQFHFTAKRAWSNDVNGPIYYNGQYHLFWQSFPYGLLWNTGYMDWGHAVSNDMLHWQELDPALRPDSLGSPWSGTAVIDNNNDGGWGKGALVLYYACFDPVSQQEVQCIAYSTDGAKTFQHYAGNPVINSDWELGTTSTRDPKVFWYAPGKVWVMVLFEKDGLSFLNSTDMRHWTRESHTQGFWECPDFFELPVDGDTTHKKWVLHGGSSEYAIGGFDGKAFTAETPHLRYAEGESEQRGELLYAAQSIENMPDGRRIQLAWGRIDHEGMPFTQMILFPTEFALKTTRDGIRLQARPIREIGALHSAEHTFANGNAADANRELGKISPGPLHALIKFTLAEGNTLRLRYQGNELLELRDTGVQKGENQLEILIDRTVAEIFLNNGQRYIVRQLPNPRNAKSLEFDDAGYGPVIRSMKVYDMRSIWDSTSQAFTEDFNSPMLNNFRYGSTGVKDAFKFQTGVSSTIEPNTKVLLFKIDPADSAGAGRGPEIISKKFTHFGSYSARIKLPDVRKVQPNTGAVAGYFTYHMDDIEGLSEIDIECLVADPTILYVGTWTGSRGKLQRIGRTINLAKGIIYNTIAKVGYDGAPTDLTGLQNQPATIPAIEGFDASARFYVYGFDWYPNRLCWWIINPANGKKIVLWDYQGSQLGIPPNQTEYRMNFWHTNTWPVDTNPQSIEKPLHPYELEVDWMKYEPLGSAHAR